MPPSYETVGDSRTSYEKTFGTRPPADLGPDEISNMVRSALQYDPRMGGNIPNIDAARAFVSNLSQGAPRTLPGASYVPGAPAPPPTPSPVPTPYLQQGSIGADVKDRLLKASAVTAEPTRVPTVLQPTAPFQGSAAGVKPWDQFPQTAGATAPATTPATSPTFQPMPAEQIIPTGEVGVELDGRALPSTFRIEGGRAVVPVRSFVDQIRPGEGKNVVWDPATGSVSYGGTKIPGVKIVNGVAVAPIRDVASVVLPGSTVGFDEARRTVTLRTASPASGDMSYGQPSGQIPSTTAFLLNPDDLGVKAQQAMIAQNVRSGRIARGSPEWDRAVTFLSSLARPGGAPNSREQAEENLIAVSEGRRPNLVGPAAVGTKPQSADTLRAGAQTDLGTVGPKPGSAGVGNTTLTGGPQLQSGGQPVPTAPGGPQPGPTAGGPPKLPTAGEIADELVKKLGINTGNLIPSGMGQPGQQAAGMLSSADIVTIVKEVMKALPSAQVPTTGTPGVGQTAFPKEPQVTVEGITNILRNLGITGQTPRAKQTLDDFIKQPGTLTVEQMNELAAKSAALQYQPTQLGLSGQIEESRAREAARLEQSREAAKLTEADLRARMEPKVKAEQQRVAMARLTTSPAGVARVGSVEKAYLDAIERAKTKQQLAEQKIMSDENLRRMGITNRQTVANLQQGIAANKDFLNLLQAAQSQVGKDRVALVKEAIGLAVSNAKLSSESQAMFQKALDAANSDNVRIQDAALDATVRALTATLTSNTALRGNFFDVFKAMLQTESAERREAASDAAALIRTTVSTTASKEQAQATARETTRRTMITNYGPDGGKALYEALEATSAGNTQLAAQKFDEARRYIDQSTQEKMSEELRKTTLNKYGPIAGNLFVMGQEMLDTIRRFTPGTQADIAARKANILQEEYDKQEKNAWSVLNQAKKEIEKFDVSKDRRDELKMKIDVITDPNLGPQGGTALLQYLDRSSMLNSLKSIAPELMTPKQKEYIQALEDPASVDGIDFAFAKAAAHWETATGRSYKEMMDRLNKQIGATDERARKQLEAMNTRFAQTLEETKRHNRVSESNAAQGLLLRTTGAGTDNYEAEQRAVTSMMERYQIGRGTAYFVRSLNGARDPEETRMYLERLQSSGPPKARYDPDTGQLIEEAGNPDVTPQISSARDRNFAYYHYNMRFGRLTTKQMEDYDKEFGSSTDRLLREILELK